MQYRPITSADAPVDDAYKEGDGDKTHIVVRQEEDSSTSSCAALQRPRRCDCCTDVSDVDTMFVNGFIASLALLMVSFVLVITFGRRDYILYSRTTQKRLVESNTRNPRYTLWLSRSPCLPHRPKNLITVNILTMNQNLAKHF